MSREADRIERCLQGDEGAYRELFDIYHRRALGVAARIVERTDVAQDVVQDSFIQAFRNLERFDRQRNFYTWLYQIVVNRSIDALRRRRRYRLSLEDRPSQNDSPEEAAGREDLGAEVRACLGRVAEPFRSALILREFQGLSCREAADLLEIPEGTVRWRLHEARRRFRGVWESRSIPASLSASD
jgi:RNA polymerase sigma-70 factor (ECF subfamily)